MSRREGNLFLFLAFLVFAPGIARAEGSAGTTGAAGGAAAGAGAGHAAGQAASLGSQAKQAASHGHHGHAHSLGHMSALQNMQAQQASMAQAHNNMVQSQIRATDSMEAKMPSSSPASSGSSSSDSGSGSSSDGSPIALGMPAFRAPSSSSSTSYEAPPSSSATAPAAASPAFEPETSDPTNPAGATLNLGSVKAPAPDDGTSSDTTGTGGDSSVSVFVSISKTSTASAIGNDQIISNLATAMAAAKAGETSTLPAIPSAAKTYGDPASPDGVSSPRLIGATLGGVTLGIGLPSSSEVSVEPSLLLSKKNPRGLRGRRLAKDSAGTAAGADADVPVIDGSEGSAAPAPARSQLVAMRGRARKGPIAPVIDDSPTNIFEYVGHTARRMRVAGTFATPIKTSRRLTVR